MVLEVHLAQTLHQAGSGPGSSISRSQRAAGSGVLQVANQATPREAATQVDDSRGPCSSSNRLVASHRAMEYGGPSQSSDTEQGLPTLPPT